MSIEYVGLIERFLRPNSALILTSVRLMRATTSPPISWRSFPSNFRVVRTTRSADLRTRQRVGYGKWPAALRLRLFY